MRSLWTHMDSSQCSTPQKNSCSAPSARQTMAQSNWAVVLHPYSLFLPHFPMLGSRVQISRDAAYCYRKKDSMRVILKQLGTPSHLHSTFFSWNGLHFLWVDWKNKAYYQMDLRLNLSFLPIARKRVMWLSQRDQEVTYPGISWSRFPSCSTLNIYFMVGCWRNSEVLMFLFVGGGGRCGRRKIN